MASISQILNMTYEQFIATSIDERRGLLEGCVMELRNPPSDAVSVVGGHRFAVVASLEDCIERGFYREAYTRIAVLCSKRKEPARR